MGEYNLFLKYYKCIMANASAMWLKAAQTTYHHLAAQQEPNKKKHHVTTKQHCKYTTSIDIQKCTTTKRHSFRIVCDECSESAWEQRIAYINVINNSSSKNGTWKISFTQIKTTENGMVQQQSLKKGIILWRQKSCLHCLRICQDLTDQHCSTDHHGDLQIFMQVKNVQRRRNNCQQQIWSHWEIKRFQSQEHTYINALRTVWHQQLKNLLSSHCCLYNQNHSS